MKPKRQAVFSLCVFVVIAVKYLLVNRMELINPNSSWHRILSSFFIMPLLLAGVYYSLGIIVDSYREKRKLIEIRIDIMLCSIYRIYFYTNFNE